ncbi:Mobile element protein [uncultured Coleofasciculus sp.]|uniref:Mobile element protein n=1 Tax=uncultured Coleofasciculus sp. TaxID=1267456 RepID=A0A6J4JVJ0_9CYAN|nr:Mobile element protein [uncultured Coleofasciculus sp.]
MIGDHSAKTFAPLWEIVAAWQCYFYVTDSEAVATQGASGWSVYPGFIPEGDQIISKTYMTRVEGENTRLRHYLARLQTLLRRYRFAIARRCAIPNRRRC